MEDEYNIGEGEEFYEGEDVGVIEEKNDASPLEAEFSNLPNVSSVEDYLEISEKEFHEEEYIENIKVEQYESSKDEYHESPKEEYGESPIEEPHITPEEQEYQPKLADEERKEVISEKKAKIGAIKEDLLMFDKQIELLGLSPRQQRIIGKHKLTPTALKTGFGIHTKRSLELALIAADRPPHICKCTVCEADISTTSTSEHESSVTESMISETYAQKLAAERLRYLMGLQATEEESYEIEEGTAEAGPAIEPENLINGLTENMRNAQKYLREHRIFEFFQFLCSHLLSAKPYDPIEFLINLLDKCLVYRSGLYAPPLLYDKRHINRLFFLMDRMGTGFIDYNQYKTGMLTLGIKSFNNNPPRNKEGLIPQNFFVEEAYECLQDLLNDILRRRQKRPAKPKKKLPRAPPPSAIPLLWPDKTECKAKPYF